MTKTIVHRNGWYWIQILMIICNTLFVTIVVYGSWFDRESRADGGKYVWATIALALLFGAVFGLGLWNNLRAMYTVVRRGDRARVNGKWYPLVDILDFEGGHGDTVVTVRDKKGRIEQEGCRGLNKFWERVDSSMMYSPFVERIRRLLDLPPEGPREPLPVKKPSRWGDA